MRRKLRLSALIMMLGSTLIMLSLFAFGHLHTMAANAKIEASPTASKNTDRTDIDWAYWQNINADLVGWVTIPGTTIDHPVLKADKDDPTYYLEHDIFKNQNIYGTPYIDSDCINDPQCRNLIIYGHHMNDGSMFSDLAKYTDESYAKEHREITFRTPEETWNLHVACVAVVDSDTTPKRISFPTEQSFHDWYQEELQQAAVVLDSATEPEKVFTLCTCSYNQFANERTLVICVP